MKSHEISRGIPIKIPEKHCERMLKEFRDLSKVKFLEENLARISGRNSVWSKWKSPRRNLWMGSSKTTGGFSGKNLGRIPGGIKCDIHARIPGETNMKSRGGLFDGIPEEISGGTPHRI